MMCDRAVACHLGIIKQRADIADIQMGSISNRVYLIENIPDLHEPRETRTFPVPGLEAQTSRHWLRPSLDKKTVDNQKHDQTHNQSSISIYRYIITQIWPGMVAIRVHNIAVTPGDQTRYAERMDTSSQNVNQPTQAPIWPGRDTIHCSHLNK